MDDNEDWLGCKRCGQFFHASCVGVNFVTALQDPFFFIVHDHTLKNTQIATYLGVFFSFFKVCDGVVAQLVQIYIRGKKNC